MIPYTGIGARKTPGKIDFIYDDNPLSWLFKYGYFLSEMKFVLRSGAADGADMAFERGCNLGSGEKEIYLPWEGFNNSDSELFYIPPEAFEIAGDIYGPTWKYAKPATKKFMARNMQQVMGFGLDEPSKFVLCWTPDGCTTKSDRTKETGGTGQAIAYAEEMEVPVFNLFNENAENELIDFILKHAHDWGLESE